MKRLLALSMALMLSAPVFAQDMPLSQVLIDGEGWKVVGKGLGYQNVTCLAADRNGNVYVSDFDSKYLHLIDKEGNIANWSVALGPAGSGVPTVKEGVSGLYVAPDGTVYACQPGLRRIISLTPEHRVVVENIDAHSMVVTRDGQMYCTVSRDLAVYRIDLADSKKLRHRVDGAVVPPAALTLWPDDGTLVIGYPASAYLWACRIEKDGTLSGKDRYYSLRLSQGHTGSGVAQMTEDVDRRLYAATREGVQIYDPTGRMNGVLLRPERAAVTAVTIGGPGHATLYIGCGGKVYGRKIKPKGAFPLGPKS